MQQNKFVLTATFCYVCPHVQINGMGYDAVYAQTKENHYVKPKANIFFQRPGVTSPSPGNNWLPISTMDPLPIGFTGENITENELIEISFHGQGNTRKFPRDEFTKRYGSPGDSELDMRSESWEKE